ncbi:hypothetical protein T552_01305 [Pneumocystis carinii B80]|uniref:Checkpoint protein RAD24-like helical bundle domain-containing protein n=1 Tax=Pneumocystis carinii (strain B80) TaxID=1408658 RepID=A0A0W4ZM23_PNEC8|nr:hypothetical protein T552_01305 [Pneumocystis carinii B80]KTW29350.1 hypothetical protein T552_01305 [Pneumocystis carinii B80]
MRRRTGLKRRKIQEITEKSDKHLVISSKGGVCSEKEEKFGVLGRSLVELKDKYLESDSICIESESEEEKEPSCFIRNVNKRSRNIMRIFDREEKNKMEKKSICSDVLMWNEKYRPLTVSDLAVSKRKVAETRNWLSIALNENLKKKLIILTGPPGSGKTATINVLSREMGFEILEWQNPMSVLSEDIDLDNLSLFSKFENFLLISKQYSSLDFDNTSNAFSDSKIILIEDLPNIYTSSSDIPDKDHDFQLAILRYISSYRNKYPLVLIITEMDFKEFDQTDNKKVKGLSLYSLLGKDIIESEKTIQISFNPITKISLQKTINKIIDIECRYSQKPNLELIESIVESSFGDIRSALNSLQFIVGIILENSNKGFSKEKNLLINSIINRDITLGFFHAIGKVIYNKRLGDSPEDKSKHLFPKNSLPSHLKVYERRISKVDPDNILDMIPVSYDIYILALHHNYLESCNDIKHVDFILSSLSYSDILLSNKVWHSSLQQRISSIVAIMGLLIGLPSPVKRSSASKIVYPIYQKIIQETKLKNDYFTDSIYKSYSNCHNLYYNTIKSSISMITEIFPYQSIILKKKTSFFDIPALIQNHDFHNSLLYDINDDIESFD